jgi:hypothetical protein
MYEIRPWRSHAAEAWEWIDGTWKWSTARLKIRWKGGTTIAPTTIASVADNSSQRKSASKWATARL